MKKFNPLYSVGYAIFGAMLTYGSLEIAIIGIKLFNSEGDRPLFVPFCFGLILLSVAALLFIFAKNVRELKTAENKRRILLLELLITVPLFLVALFGTAVAVNILRGIF